MANTAKSLQDFYARTAATYDDDHVLDVEHDVALGIAGSLLRSLGARTVLDLGCGTGRAMARLQPLLPDGRLFGIDPSADLLGIAAAKTGSTGAKLVRGDGMRLPFRDESIDAVVATAVLHHVSEPSAVVSEMLRVARLAIFVSDTNTYAQGRLPERLAKIAARRLGVLPRLQAVRNGGHRWYVSDGDGVAYPYSVFDSVAQVEQSCGRCFVIPTQGSAGRHSIPLLNARNALLVGIKAGRRL